MMTEMTNEIFGEFAKLGGKRDFHDAFTLTPGLRIVTEDEVGKDQESDSLTNASLLCQ
jgi:hypothetical protein